MKHKPVVVVLAAICLLLMSWGSAHAQLQPVASPTPGAAAPPFSGIMGNPTQPGSQLGNQPWNPFNGSQPGYNGTQPGQTGQQFGAYKQPDYAAQRAAQAAAYQAQLQQQAAAQAAAQQAAANAAYQAQLQQQAAAQAAAQQAAANAAYQAQLQQQAAAQAAAQQAAAQAAAQQAAAQAAYQAQLQQQALLAPPPPLPPIQGQQPAQNYGGQQSYGGGGDCYCVSAYAQAAGNGNTIRYCNQPLPGDTSVCVAPGVWRAR